MLKGLKLTGRDLKVIKDILEHGFLSFHQVWSEHYVGLKRPTVANRMSKLVKANVLNSLKIDVCIHQGVARKVGVVYTPTGLSVNLINAVSKDEVFDKKNHTEVNTSTLYHDLKLTDVVFKLRKNYPDLKIKNAKSLKVFNQRRIADAYLYKGNESLALEIELTVKSSRRYRDIIMSYKMDKSIDKVLYVYSKSEIKNKIMSEILGYKVTSDSQNGTKLRPISLGKFYFCHIDDVLNPIEKAVFTNGNSFWPEGITEIEREVI